MYYVAYVGNVFFVGATFHVFEQEEAFFAAPEGFEFGKSFEFAQVKLAEVEDFTRADDEAKAQDGDGQLVGAPVSVAHFFSDGFG